MPATPKFGDCGTVVGKVEIQRQTVADKEGYSRCEVRVTGKIAIKLNCEGINCHKSRKSVITESPDKCRGYKELPDNFRKNTEFQCSEDNHTCSLSDILFRYGYIFSLHLGDEIGIPHQWSEKHFRKKTQKKQIVGEMLQWGDFPTIAVDDV